VADEVKDAPTFKAAAKIGAKIRQYAGENKTLATENATLKDQLAKLTAKVTTLESQVSNPSKDRARVAELEKQIRDDRHRSAFTRLAKAAGAADDLVDDLYDRSGYTAEGDEPDDDQLAQVLDEVKAKKPSAFGRTAAAEPVVPGKPAPKPVAGAGRGEPHRGKDGTIITAEMRADPTFMLNPRNREVIQAAAKEGRFR
jgi:hypothetical protein